MMLCFVETTTMQVILQEKLQKFFFPYSPRISLVVPSDPINLSLNGIKTAHINT
jgi:hypothetical protein